MAKTFVLSDDSLNNYGFRILTAGIDIEQFVKNPVMYFMHMRPGDFAMHYTVIGRWENIRKEGSQLLADPVFDMDDPFAASIARKVENNFLRMASIGAQPVETSADAKYILPGQRYESVIKSIAVEASIVDRGGNNNALALCDVPALYNEKQSLIELSAGDQNPLIPLLLTQTPDMLIKLTDAATILQLAENATEQQVVEAIKKLKADKDEAEIKLKNFQEAQRHKEINDLVELAVTEKKITAAQKEDFVKLATGDFESTKKILDGMKPYEPVETQLKDTTGGDAEVEALLKMSGTELWKAGKLEVLKLKNPEAFKLKFKECFGVEPKA